MNPDRALVTETVARLGLLVDRRDWKALEALFAPTVEVDYTSLFGGSAETKERSELVGGWAEFLPRFSKTQHLIGWGAVDLDGDTARVRAPVVAWHFTGDSLHGEATSWTVGGHYDVRLRRMDGRWLIEGLTLEAAWQDPRS